MKLRARAAIAACTFGVAFTVLASPAFALVTMEPNSVPQGADAATLTFVVPNDVANADTIRFDVKFPIDHPIANVEVQSTTNGFTSEVRTTHLSSPLKTDEGTLTDVVSEVIWSGGKIAPGQYGEFKVLAQGIPTEPISLAFPATQTFSDGNVVSWTQTSPNDGQDPSYPAPSIDLTPDGGGAAVADDAAPSAPTVGSRPDNTLTIAALVVAGAALLIASVSLLRKPGTGG